MFYWFELIWFELFYLQTAMKNRGFAASAKDKQKLEGSKFRIYISLSSLCP